MKHQSTELEEVLISLPPPSNILAPPKRKPWRGFGYLTESLSAGLPVVSFSVDISGVTSAARGLAYVSHQAGGVTDGW